MIGFSVAYLLESYSVGQAQTGIVEKSRYSSDLVIKVPVSLPYFTGDETAEISEGRILHDGEPYLIRTRQMINDTIYIHCEYDQNARDRFADLGEQVKYLADLNHHPKRSSSSLLKQFLKDFLAVTKGHLYLILEWIPSQGQVFDRYQATIYSADGGIPSPPPDQTSVYFSKN